MFNPTTHSLVLRACNEDMSSTKGFIWPTSGLVECSDWNPVSKCGNGLHGWLYGHGDGSVSEYWSVSDRWLVVAVETKSIVELEGKVKFPKGEVVFCDISENLDYLDDCLLEVVPVSASSSSLRVVWKSNFLS